MKWEYKEVTYNDLQKGKDRSLIEPGLNLLGKDGWELVGVTGDNERRYHSYFIFKRPVQPVE